MSKATLALIILLAVTVFLAYDQTLQDSHLQTDSNISSENMIKKQTGLQRNDQGKNTQQNYTFQQDSLYGKLMVNQRFIYFTKQSSNPTIKRLDLSNMNLQTFQYDHPREWDKLFNIQLLDMKNGDIAFGGSYYVYFLDNQTLAIKQTLAKQIQYQFVLNLQSYFNEPTGQYKYLVLKKENYAYEYIKQEDGTYAQKLLFYIDWWAYENFFLTGMNSGVSTSPKRCQVNYWANLNAFIDLSLDPKYYLLDQETVAMSNEEKMFVTVNKSNHFEFYSVSEKFENGLTSVLYINKDTLRKGAFTSDDKSFFISTYNGNNQYRVAKVEVETTEFTFIPDFDGKTDNQVDFQILHRLQNRFVTLCVRGKGYYLQLRALNDSSTIIHQLPARLNFTVLEAKLIGNAAWGNTFGLALRKLPYDGHLFNDSELFLYKVQDDKIVFIPLVSAAVSFAFLKACGPYAVTTKVSYDYFNVFSIENLLLAKKVYCDYITEKRLTVEKDTLIVNGQDQFTVYDFRNSLEPKGYLNRIYQSRVPSLELIFQDRGALQQSLTEIIDGFKVRALYNISSPAIVSSIKIAQSFCNSLSYYIPPSATQQPQGLNCNSLFYIETTGKNAPNLVRYSECTKVKEVQPINFPGAEFVSLFISSDKRYVLLALCKWGQDPYSSCLIEARPISAIKTVIYHELYDVKERSPLFASESIGADLVDDTMLVVKTVDSLYVKQLEKTQAQ